MNIENVSQRIRQLSQELTLAQHDGDDDEVERIEIELEEAREEMEALELDAIDDRRHGRGR